MCGGGRRVYGKSLYLPLSFAVKLKLVNRHVFFLRVERWAGSGIVLAGRMGGGGVGNPRLLCC